MLKKSWEFLNLWPNRKYMKLKRLITLLILGIFTSIQAQKTISGTFYPSEEYTWVIAYYLKPGSQVYEVDTTVKEGAFTLQMPKDAKTGMYRIVYAVPQEEFYFDVIYNGKEDIVLTFNANEGAIFKTSFENQLFHDYFKKVAALEQKIIAYYKTKETNTAVFTKLTKELKGVQKMYLEKSKNTIAYNFIAANNPYIPSKLETLETYVKHRKEQYFTTLDFKNPVLQASNFLTDKVLNYVLTALPLKPLSPEATELEMQKNLRIVAYFMEGANSIASAAIYYNLWLQLSASKFNKTADFVYNNYLKPLANENGQTEIIETIEVHNRLRIGAVAPEITWKEAGIKKKLSSLEESLNYLLVFWSSTCSHCLVQLPKIHKALENNTNTKVIAIGLEDADGFWKIETQKLKDFIHVISLGKWESKYAELYAIKATPSYFILNKDKKIVAKPEEYEEVISFLNATTN